MNSLVDVGDKGDLMANKKTRKNKKQKESEDMEMTLIKSAKLEDLDGSVDYDMVDEIISSSKKTKEQKDLETALELLSDEKKVIIDRDQEDQDVTEFQKTGDLELLEKVYKSRIPTLKSWAAKNYYPGLTTSVEDLFEDLSLVFVNAAEKYDKNKGKFNTWLFKLLLNRLKNLHNAKYAKKRKSDEYDGPMNGMILSLDYSYSDGDGSELTLKDIIPSKTDVEESLGFRDSVDFLSKDNPLVKEFFNKICAGNSLASLIKEYKTRSGTIDLSRSKNDLLKLKSGKNKRLVADIIKARRIKNRDFKLIEYQLGGSKGNKLIYTVEMRKTEETDFLIKFIRNLKKHKEYYLSKMRGN